MATLRNKRKLAAVTRETQEEHPRNGQSRNTSVPRINEEYITQVSEEIESRVTKKLSQEFSRAESRILGALSKLDEFLLNPQITTHSETVPGTFRNTNVENQGTNEDDSQSDPHPEASIFCGQTTQNSDLNECCDIHYFSPIYKKHGRQIIRSNCAFFNRMFANCLYIFTDVRSRLENFFETHKMFVRTRKLQFEKFSGNFSPEFHKKSPKFQKNLLKVQKLL